MNYPTGSKESMQTLIQEKINVNAIYRGFNDNRNSKSNDWAQKRIEPLSFKRSNHQTFKIAQIRKSYAARKGKALHVHFVVRTSEDRYFELVYDSEKITWILQYEFDDALLFN